TPTTIAIIMVRLLPGDLQTFLQAIKLSISVISYQLSVISYQLSIISYQLSVISYQLSVISYQLSVISLGVGMGMGRTDGRTE
ncbi:MAG: hypothetical protein OEX02_21290, partial [Cyclobacteriaceae bacterium]|nr:hypothetical protein [Cyclobacteriaceae bacterium]